MQFWPRKGITWWWPQRWRLSRCFLFAVSGLLIVRSSWQACLPFHYCYYNFRFCRNTTSNYFLWYNYVLLTIKIQGRITRPSWLYWNSLPPLYALSKECVYWSSLAKLYQILRRLVNGAKLYSGCHARTLYIFAWSIKNANKLWMRYDNNTA